MMPRAARRLLVMAMRVSYPESSGHEDSATSDHRTSRHNVRVQLPARVCRAVAERPCGMQTRAGLLQPVVVPPYAA